MDYKQEKFSRIELLKKLAYKHEDMSIKDVLTHYASFMSKVEKGKFKWGSRKDLVAFDQQLMYAISLERAKTETRTISRSADTDKVRTRSMVREEKKKYCLDFNKGLCRLQSPHEGTLNGTNVLKYHLCKRCLLEEGIERTHPSKDCVRK